MELPGDLQNVPDEQLTSHFILDELKEKIPQCDVYLKAIHAIEDKVAETQGWSITTRQKEGKCKMGCGVIGVVGGVCTIIAPFTAGGSLVAFSIAGGAAGVGSALGGIGTSLWSVEENTRLRNELIRQEKAFIDASNTFGTRLARVVQNELQLNEDMLKRAALTFFQLGLGLTELIILNVQMYRATLPAISTAFEKGLAALPMRQLDGMQRFFDSLSQVSRNSCSTTASAPCSVANTGSGIAASRGSANTSASQANKLTASKSAKVFGVIGGVLQVGVGLYDISCGLAQLGDGNPGDNEKIALQLLRELLNIRASVIEIRAGLLTECARRVEMIGAATSRRRQAGRKTMDLNTLPGFEHFSGLDAGGLLDTLPDFADFENPGVGDFELQLNPDPLGRFEAA